MIIILHNIRSVYNVGSIFRTADAAGVGEIILSGYTPTPLDRFGRERTDMAKVALGAQKSVPWKRVKTLGPTLSRLRRENYTLAALEQDAHAKNIFEYAYDMRKHKNVKLALILGNEVGGISKSLLNKCDGILEIPMRGTMVRQAHHPRNSKRGKESLNVSVAAGIALFALKEKRG